MDKKHEIRKELEDIAPSLSRLKEKNEGFRIPDNYFDQMQDEVMHRLKTEPEQEMEVVHRQSRSISLRSRYRFWLKVAGFAFVVLAAAYLLLPDGSGTGSGSEPYLAELTPADASAYVNNNLDEFDLDVMLEVAEVDPSDLFPVQKTSEKPLEEEVMEEYIDDILDDFDLEDIEDLL